MKKTARDMNPEQIKYLDREEKKTGKIIALARKYTLHEKLD